MYMSNLKSKLTEAFFTELYNFLDTLVKLYPSEAPDIIVYRALVRNCTNFRDREMFISTLDQHIFSEYKVQILTHDIQFLTNQASSIIQSKVDSQYLDEATDWLNKIKKLYHEGKVSKDQEVWIWKMLETFLKLNDKIKSIPS